MMADRTAKQGLADLREEGKRVEGEIRELGLCLRTCVCVRSRVVVVW